MPTINLTPSGQGVDAEAIQLTAPDPDIPYTRLIKDAYDLIKKEQIQYFQNCFFQVSDLRKVKDQEGCTYLMFSHIVGKRTSDGKKYSTASVLGAMGNHFFLEDEDIIFFSNNVDVDTANLDFTELVDFKQGTPLELAEPTNMTWQIDENTVEFKEFHGTQKETFAEWINQFKDSEKSPNTIVAQAREDGLILGIYFSVDTLDRLGYFNDENELLGLFPITLETDFPNEASDIFPRSVVSYLLVPAVKDGAQFSLKYADNSQLLASADSWPEIWRDHL